MTNTFTIHNGDSAEVLKSYPDNYFDSVVCDPPYGISFLGKKWDANTGELNVYVECLRVLKPGGHLLAFSAARTYHHLATTLELAGFEIRDQIMWLYGSGFPKSQDIGKAIQKRIGVTETRPTKDNGGARLANNLAKNNNTSDPGYSGIDTICTSPQALQFAGWKTALKPSHEPIAVARKPFKGSTIDNMLEHGVGGFNIDANRVGDDIVENKKSNSRGFTVTLEDRNGDHVEQVPATMEYKTGRYPANTVGTVPEAAQIFPAMDYTAEELDLGSHYLYQPKVSRAERHVGFDTSEIQTKAEMAAEMGGYLCDHEGKPNNSTNTAMIPHLGIIYLHGLAHELAKWRATQQNPDLGSHYLYQPKVSRAERHVGFDTSEIPTNPGGMYDVDGTGRDFNAKQQDALAGVSGNNHPTVKPVALMRWLVRLVTPKGGTVLDPFTGSGSTGMAAMDEGCNFVGCEIDPAYVKIAETRIAAWRNRPTTPVKKPAKPKKPKTPPAAFDQLFGDE